MLSALVRKFDRLTDDLIVAVRSGNEEEIGRLDAQLQPLIQRIFEFQAHSQSDIAIQISFFDRLVTRNSEDGGSVRRFSTMMSHLFFRYLKTAADVAEISQAALSSPPVEGYDPSLHELLLDSVPERVAVFDLDYRYIYCNRQNAEFHNKKPSDFIGKHMLDFIDRDRFLSRAKPRIDQCFGGARVHYSYEATDANGRAHDVHCRMTPLIGADKTIIGAVLVLNMQPVLARTG